MSCDIESLAMLSPTDSWSRRLAWSAGKSDRHGYGKTSEACLSHRSTAALKVASYSSAVVRTNFPFRGQIMSGFTVSEIAFSTTSMP